MLPSTRPSMELWTSIRVLWSLAGSTDTTSPPLYRERVPQSMREASRCYLTQPIRHFGAALRTGLLGSGLRGSSHFGLVFIIQPAETDEGTVHHGHDFHEKRTGMVGLSLASDASAPMTTVERPDKCEVQRFVNFAVETAALGRPVDGAGATGNMFISTLAVRWVAMNTLSCSWPARMDN